MLKQALDDVDDEFAGAVRVADAASQLSKGSLPIATGASCAVLVQCSLKPTALWG